MRRCDLCEWYDEPQCRKYAPDARGPANEPTEHNHNYVTVFHAEWPQVQPDDWCGEWQPMLQQTLEERRRELRDKDAGIGSVPTDGDADYGADKDD